MKKCIQIVSILFMLCQILFVSEPVHATIAKDKEHSYIIASAHNGLILNENNSQNRQNVGKLSQLLAIYLIYQAIDKGTIQLDQNVPISEEAYALSQDYGIANVPLRVDGEYRVDELLAPVVTASANGALLALAELVAGSSEAFVQAMQKQAEVWGIKDLSLINVTGLPKDYQLGQGGANLNGDTNQMSAEGLATVAYHLLANYPQVLDLSKVDRATFRKNTPDAFDYSNGLLQNGYFFDAKIDGFRLESKGEDDQMRLSGVMTTASNGIRTIFVYLDVEAKQFEPVGLELLQSTQRGYQLHAIAKKGQPVTQIDALAEYGSKEPVALAYSEALDVIVPVQDIAPQLHYDFVPNADHFTDKRTKTPLSKGTVIGEVVIGVENPETHETIAFATLPGTKGNCGPIALDQDTEEKLANDAITATTRHSVWRKVRRFFNRALN